MASNERKIIDLLSAILLTLNDMKRQEREYWETWKNAKEKENKCQ